MLSNPRLHPTAALIVIDRGSPETFGERNELLAYRRHLWLSIPLGLAGMGLLARVVRRPDPPDTA